MPSTTTYYGLALYNSTTDASETFLNYRSAIAGTSASSNMNLLDAALKDIQDQLDVLTARKGIVPVAATYISANYYEATTTDITSYDTDQVIALKLDIDSNGTVTLNINALGTKSLAKVDSTGAFVNLAGTDLRANREYNFKYDGTRWVWMDAQSADQINTNGTTGNLVSIATDNSLEDSTYAPTDFAVAAKGVTNGDSHDHIGGDGAAIAEGAITLSDVTTNDVSTSKHGFIPKLSGNAGDILNGVGSWVPSNGVAFKNLIINGAMNVAQRGTSEASITTAGYKAAPDRWYFARNGIGTWTVSQDTANAPTDYGFGQSYKIQCTTASASPASTDSLVLQQRIEGQYLQHLLKGSAGAKSLTLQFLVRSSIASTFVVELVDNDNTRSISSAYTISATDTWEQKTITFVGDTSGLFDNDNNASLYLNFWLAAGSNFTSGTLQTSWGATTSANRAVGQSNLAGTLNNTFFITGVQLEVSEYATYFEHLPWDIVLQRCQRYYQKSFEYATAPATGVGANSGESSANVLGSAVVARAQIIFQTPMRSNNPTMTGYNPVSANALARDFSAAADFTSTAFIISTQSGGYWYGNSPASSAIADRGGIHWTADDEL